MHLHPPFNDPSSWAWQSLSFSVSQPEGQHPSPSTQNTTGTLEQATLQLAADPVIRSVVQLS